MILQTGTKKDFFFSPVSFSSSAGRHVCREMQALAKMAILAKFCQ